VFDKDYILKVRKIQKFWNKTLNRMRSIRSCYVIFIQIWWRNYQYRKQIKEDLIKYMAIKKIVVNYKRDINLILWQKFYRWMIIVKRNSLQKYKINQNESCCKLIKKNIKKINLNNHVKSAVLKIIIMYTNYKNCVKHNVLVSLKQKQIPKVMNKTFRLRLHNDKIEKNKNIMISYINTKIENIKQLKVDQLLNKKCLIGPVTLNKIAIYSNKSIVLRRLYKLISKFSQHIIFNNNPKVKIRLHPLIISKSYNKVLFNQRFDIRTKINAPLIFKKSFLIKKDFLNQSVKTIQNFINKFNNNPNKIKTKYITRVILSPVLLDKSITSTILKTNNMMKKILFSFRMYLDDKSIKIQKKEIKLSVITTINIFLGYLLLY